MPTRTLDCGFYSRPPTLVAQQLLGKLLVSTIGGLRSAGRIVETEAYLASGDTACHGQRGQTSGNAAMFGSAGIAYVYPIHARHCFNIVTESAGKASAVLIRAIEPLEGISQMKKRRGRDSAAELCSGPARLCQALGIDRNANGLNLTLRRTLWLAYPPTGNEEEPDIRATRRIGVTSARELELRFVIRGNRFASGPAYLR